MFNLEIYRQHWIFFALSLGIILTLVIVLAYLAMWRERGAEREAQLDITDVRTFVIWFQRAFPWVLILTFAGTWFLAILYPLMKAANPPNW
jgi:hypothetical protein